MENGYYREGLTPGKYGTFCYNKAIAAGHYEGAEFYKVVERNSEYITLEEVTDLAAGEAYIFMATATVLFFEYHGDYVAEPVAASPYNVLQGSFVNNTTIPEGAWFLHNNQLYQSTGTQKVDANRAYLTDITPAAVAPVPGRRRVTMPVHRVATGLDNTESGQDNVQKVLRNSQIYIIRNGHMYSVQGQMVN